MKAASAAHPYVRLRGLACLRLVVLGVTSVVLMSGSAAAASRLVTFQSTSGRTVTGLFTDADRQPAPAVVLVPMLGRPKDDWQAVADRLAAAGVHALAIDLPGPDRPGGSQELLRWHEDVRAAVTFVAGLAAVRPGALGMAGASLGANLVAVAAAAEPGVRSIALVSPSLDYRGVRIEAPMERYGARQALLAASVQDPYAARSVRELATIGTGTREVRWSNVPAHGTTLLSRDPDLVRVLVEWFQQTLG
jgi:alpha-beta hydrolase superfamily lysophospholipase